MADRRNCSLYQRDRRLHNSRRDDTIWQRCFQSNHFHGAFAPFLPLYNGTSGTAQFTADRTCRLERLSQLKLLLDWAGWIFPDIWSFWRSECRIRIYRRYVCTLRKRLCCNLPPSGYDRGSRDCRESNRRNGKNRYGCRLGWWMVSACLRSLQK